MAETSATAAETSPTAAAAAVTDPTAPLKAREQLIEWVRTALPTVVGAIGLTGFVSILGGALIWVRFSTAALPADQAVGELPTSQLLVTGAVSLVLYLVLGLAAVGLVYLLQRAVLTRVVDDSAAPDKIKSLEDEHTLTLARVAQLSERIAGLTPVAPPDSSAAPGAAASSGGPGAPVATAELTPATAPGGQTTVDADDTGTEQEPADNQAHDARPAMTPSVQQALLEQAVQGQLTDLEHQRLEAGERADEIASELYEAQLKVSKNASGAVRGGQYGLVVLAAVEFALVVVRTDATEGSKIGLIALLGVAVVFGVCFGYLASARIKRGGPKPAEGSDAAKVEQARVQSIRNRRQGVRWATAALALIAAVWLVGLDEWTLLPTLVCAGLTGANYAVSRLRPSRFFWLGISIFVSVVLFGAVLTYSRSNNAPSAQPAAVLLKDGCTLHGLWIGESSDRVYLARVTETNIAKHGESPEWLLSEGRIFWVSRSQVASESVGTLQRVRNATLEAPRLENELSSIQAHDALTTEACKSAAKPDPPKPKPVPPKPNKTKHCRKKRAKHRARTHRGGSV